MDLQYQNSKNKAKLFIPKPLDLVAVTIMWILKLCSNIIYKTVTSSKKLIESGYIWIFMKK